MSKPVEGAGSANTIAAVIRAAMAERAQGRQRAEAPKKGKLAQGQAKSSQPPLSALVAARVEELDADAPDYQSRLLRLVLEAALLNEFGGALINAPKFQSMVDQILQDLQATPLLKTEITAVIDGLSSGRWPA